MRKWHLALLLTLPTICKAPVQATCHITKFEDDNGNTIQDSDTEKNLPMNEKTRLFDIVIGNPLPLFATLLSENEKDCEIKLVDGYEDEDKKKEKETTLTLPYDIQHPLTFCAGYLILKKVEATK